MHSQQFKRPPDPQRALDAYFGEMLHQGMGERSRDLRLTQIQEPPEECDRFTPTSNTEPMIDSVQGAVNHCQQEWNIDALPSQQYLLFRVNGQCLSIPIVHLRAIIWYHFPFIRAPRLPAWLLGLTKFRSGYIPVANSCHLFSMKTDGNFSPRYILILQNGKWGVTCDQVDQVLELDNDEVTRGDSGCDGLSQGTLRDSKAILLSADRIIEHLNALQQSMRNMASLLSEEKL